MYDPESGKLDVEAAEIVLGIEEGEKQVLLLNAGLKLVMARLEITEADLQRAYETQLVDLLRSTHEAIDSVVVGGLDAVQS